MTTPRIPSFRYHADPIATGSAVERESKCICCAKSVPIIYVASRYCEHADVGENLCLQCIASGLAHEKFDVLFVDPYPLEEAGLQPSVVKEVTTRTPGYISWQQEEWLSHCDDACQFLGDASRANMGALTDRERDQICSDFNLEKNLLSELIDGYEPGGQPAFYHFRCLHCGTNRFGMDFT